MEPEEKHGEFLGFAFCLIYCWSRYSRNLQPEMPVGSEKKKKENKT
jgi:hypothetical protein